MVHRITTERVAELEPIGFTDGEHWLTLFSRSDRNVYLETRAIGQCALFGHRSGPSTKFLLYSDVTWSIG